MLYNFVRLRNVFGKHYDVVSNDLLHDRVPVFTVDKETEFINILMKFFMITTTKDASPQYDEERAKELVENVPDIVAMTPSQILCKPLRRCKIEI